MRMKKITIALAAALAVLSACEKTPALPVVQFDKTNYILPADEPVTVKVVSDVALTDDVTFTLGGTAVKDVDYTVSPEQSVSFTDVVAAEIVITPLNNLEDKNIVLELAAKAGSFTVGQNVKATVVITPKEKVYCSFEKAGVRLAGTTERTIALKLVGASTGDKFQASGELKIPFTVSGTAVEGTDYEIVGGEKFLVAADGAKVATVKIKSKHETAPETIPTLTIAFTGSERFLVGVNASTEVIFGGALQFTELIGKWTYSSYPIKDDKEADLSLFEMMAFSETGDTWDNIPCNHFDATSSIEFKTIDGVDKILVSGPGDIFDYLVGTEVTGLTPCTYSWYYYQPVRPLENAVKLTLAKVNASFSPTVKDEKEGSIILNLNSEGFLDVIIPDTSFRPAPGLYYKGIMAYEDGLLWNVQTGNTYFDCYYVFKKVAE